MSDCDVCIGGFDGDDVDNSSSSVKTARRNWKCCECGQIISKGQQYEHYALLMDGKWSTYHSCLSCVEIRDVFTCGQGWFFTALWEDMEEIVFPVLTTATKCLQKLSPANKTRVIEEWQKWKGLTA